MVAPMRIRTPADLGVLIRNTRKKRKLDQSALARKVGVSRLWLVEIEQGKPRAEIGLVLRTLDTLRITLTATMPESAPTKRSQGNVDIDAIISAARNPRK
jgi:HTH-type transcriptional regulator/antitoxin HipB